MMRLAIGVVGLLLLPVFGGIFLILLLLTGGPLNMSCSLSCLPNENLVGVALAAQTLQQHVFGWRANQYDIHDPVIQRVLPYWETSCGSGGHLCSEAQSGNLQCVEFVSGAFFLGGTPLPGVANAEDLWPLYQQKAGWSEIPATAYPPSLRGLPSPGDMMVWRGGGHLEEGQYIEYGHVAVVIAVSPPQGIQNGFVTVAQGNAPGNRWDMNHASDPGNWYTMPLLPDLSVPTWGAFTNGEGMHYDSYTVLGYIRQRASMGAAASAPPQLESLPTLTTMGDPSSSLDLNALIHGTLTAVKQTEHPVLPAKSKSLAEPFCLATVCLSTPIVVHSLPVAPKKTTTLHLSKEEHQPPKKAAHRRTSQQVPVHLHSTQLFRKPLKRGR